MQSALARSRQIGSRIGLLYAANTGGAILGALLAGFYFVPILGMARPFRIAAGTNLTIGAIAQFAGSRIAIAGAPSLDDRNQEIDLAPQTLVDARSQRAVLWTFILSGLLSLALEIVWFRMLVIFLRPTAYAFTLMLASVLAGIAVGSATATPLLRRSGPWLAILTLTQLAIGVAAVLSFNLLAKLQTAVDWLGPALTPAGLDSYFVPILVGGALAMLPTTLLLGFAFPIGLSCWATDDNNRSRRIGTFYSLNVVGAVVGSILGGFVLLPFLGSRGSLVAVSSLAVLSSARF
ncbi:MAG TPA: fused MFS/spermidine synthase [Vicinamibacterales bacterium]|nr:fused MFS/spermidine synthase [Vicinamibacterales bacterium]